MKKALIILLSLALMFSLAACSGGEAPEPAPEPPAQAEEPALAPEEPPEPEPPAGPVAEEVMGVTIPELEVFVNGISVTHEMLAAYPVYSVLATSVNSSGTESTVTYIGFAIKDVLDAAGLTDNYIWLEATADDGYTINLKGDVVMEDTTLLALTKDGSPFGDAPWLAPCTDTVTGNYLKGTVSILVNTSDESPGMEHTMGGGGAGIPDGLPEILDRTDKVEFAPYSFLVNGNEITNETLEGLSIFKITVFTEGRDGVVNESQYTGYNLADVLERLELYGEFITVTAVASDGYEAKYDGDMLHTPYTLVAIERDGSVSDDGSIWLAPCAETSANRYTRDVVELIVEQLVVSS